MGQKCLYNKWFKNNIFTVWQWFENLAFSPMSFGETEESQWLSIELISALGSGLSQPPSSPSSHKPV